MKYVPLCIMLMIGVSGCATHEKTKDVLPPKIVPIDRTISKLRSIQHLALSYKGPQDRSFAFDERFVAKLMKTIAADVEHPSELSSLAFCLHELYDVKAYEKISGEGDTEGMERYSEYFSILEMSFWYCVGELCAYTDWPAMEEMGKLYEYLKYQGEYDAGNALRINEAMEAQQWKASRQRGENDLWRLDPWFLRDGFPLPCNIEACYWIYREGMEPGINGKLQYYREGQGYIEVNEHTVRRLLDSYAWAEIPSVRFSFDPPAKSEIADRFRQSAIFYELKTPFSEIVKEPWFSGGRIVLSPAAKVICFDLHTP